ncbi:MAG: YegS/Rv2252/BmrU family lipid kinase, partial [Proteobacteria bacterium]|nr:YegS/Rv2252/BmrU family lipid kinase [Pseudomonadota bacterium]
MTARPVHLFLNPTAGRGRAGKREARIRELLGKDDIALDVHRSRAVGDLEKQVRERVDAGARRIVVAGGDGSVHEAVNGIMRAAGDAAFGVIPTGTGNDFAKAAGIPLDWRHATALLAGRMATGTNGRSIDIGRMNDRYFANGAGIGLDARVTRIARSYRAPIGDLVYLLAIFRAMLEGIASPHMRIVSESANREGATTLVNVANGDWIGGMFNIAPNARNHDGRFDLLVVAPVSRPRILQLLPKLMA